MMKLKSMLVACVAAIGLGVFADPLPDGDGCSELVGNYIWTFSVQDGEATIEQGTFPEPTGNLTLPSELGGCPVTGIGEYAFEYHQGLQSVVIPEGVRVMGAMAFYNCTRLKSVFVPASVEFIGDRVFTASWELDGLSVADDNPYYRTENGVLYDKDKTTVYFWPNRLEVVIPDTVRRIADWAIDENYTLRGASFELPSSVTNVGVNAFNACQLSALVLNEGLVTIGDQAFNNNALRHLVIPSTVKTLGWLGNQLSAVFFKGNAPECDPWNLYSGASEELTTFVRAGTTGWLNEGSSELPEVWPVNGNQRPIREWTTYPLVGWMVRFELGEYGVRTGGGELEQMVAEGSSAVAPEVGSADDGEHEFVGWDCDFSHVTGPMTVQASYVKRGLKLIEDVTTSVAVPWAPVADVNYTVVGEAGASERVLYLEYLTGGVWQKVPSSLISGELSLEAGQHAVSIPLADLGLEGRETVFRLIVREKGTSGVDVYNADGWAIDAKNRGAWRSRPISGNQQTSLFATTFGAGELTFSWKASSEDVSWDWLEWFVDGVSQGKIGGETDWMDQSVFFDDGNEHQIEWRYCKDDSVDGGQDCGWVANVEMGEGESVSETPFTVAVPSPVISLVASLTDNGSVALVADDPSATIYFTTDGGVPTAESEEYVEQVTWEVFRTMKAVAIAGSDKWSNLIDGRDCVRITLDPELGTVDTKAVIRQSGASYGELPVPEREGCEFLGWTLSTWDWWGEQFVDVVPQQDTTLFAAWDVPPELILDPEGSFESIEYDWTDFGRYCDELGYFDEANMSYVVTDRLWHEYLRTTMEMTPGSSNVFLSATFSGAGIVEFGYLEGNTDQMICYVDGERTDLDTKVEQFGDPMGAFMFFTKHEVKVLSSGNHRLELVLASEGSKSYGYLSSCQIGGMKWAAAKSGVMVEFDAMGGEIDKEAQAYQSGNAYGSFPALSERSGFEFLGWFTDPVGGERKTESDLVDFEVTKLYAHWRTDLGMALNNTRLEFSSSGATGWDGQCGVSHDGVASAASGWLEWNETNTLSTTLNGRGVLNFWWKTDGGSLFGDVNLSLNVDGRTIPLRHYSGMSTNAHGWLRFSLSITNESVHTIKWKAALDSTSYNETAELYRQLGIEVLSVRDQIDQYKSLGGEMVSDPGVWIDEVEWLQSADQTDVVQWGNSAYQARRILPGKADPMIAWCDQRIAENPEDYDAHVRRAITRLKALSEDPVFRTLLARYGYAFSEELMAITGTFNVDNAPLSNEAVDIVAGEAMPTLEMILADLDFIPEGWDGTVALPASQYPVDEDVYIDYADVVMAKACVHGAKAAILIAQGYDLTIDNQKLYDEVTSATNRKQVVVSEFTGRWADCQLCRMKGVGADGYMRLASDGSKLQVRLALPEVLPDECEDADGIFVNIDLEGALADVPDQLSTMNDSLMLGVDLTSETPEVSGMYFTGWDVIELSGVKASRTAIGQCVNLEVDFSGVDGIGSIGGFLLDDARIRWVKMMEMEFGGEMMPVPEDVFVVESKDGMDYDPELSIESVLDAHPQCASAIRNQASLNDAKLETRLALNLYEKFDIAIRSRTSGMMHFFEYDPQYDEQWQAVAKFVQLAKMALDDVVTVKGEDYVCFKKFKQTNLNERVTLKPFFDGKILRNLLPPFEGDRPVLSSIPDITFAGTFPDWTMENRMEWLRMIDGIWYDGAFPPVVSAPASFDGPFAEVVITDRSPEARIFYTTDSSDPAENGKEYTEPFNVFASCTIRAVAVTEQFGTSEETTATVEKMFGIGDAVGSYDATIACTSVVPWTVDMSVAHDGGEASMRSGAITSSEESPDRNYSTMSATYAGKGTLVFWWKVSCEDDGSKIGAEYDFLGVYVNGVRKYAIDGKTDWERVELAFTDEGEHLIEWRYSKNDLDEEEVGEDCGWVDDIVWIPEESAGAIPGVTLSTFPAVPFDWIDRHGLGPRYENGGNTFEQAAKMPSPTGKRDANGNVLSVLDEYVAGTDPQNENDTFHAEIEFEDGKAVIKWHPELSPEEAAKRVYRTFGRELLGSGEWVELIDGDTDGFNFFKTSVEWK